MPATTENSDQQTECLPGYIHLHSASRTKELASTDIEMSESSVKTESGKEKFLLRLDYAPSSYKSIDALDYFIVCVALGIKGVEATLDSEQDPSPNSVISLEPHLPAGPTER